MFRIMVMLTILASLCAMGCNTVTLVKATDTQTSDEPNYQDSRAFFLFGLIGTQHVDTNQICNGKDIEQVQTQETFVDGFLSVITIGIYTPRSVKIWCTRGES